MCILAGVSIKTTKMHISSLFADDGVSSGVNNRSLQCDICLGYVNLDL